MKTQLFFAFIGLIAVTAVSCTTSKGATTRAEKEIWIKQKVDSVQFTIEVDKAFPSVGQPINLTSLYSLELRNDTVLSYLPYFGRAYVAPMDPREGGFIFDLPIINYSKSFSAKKGYLINFSAKGKDDIYRFTVEITLGGYADISVITNNRSFIRYSGQIVNKSRK